jgi:hypothetical protein
MKKGWTATIQILIPEEEGCLTEAEACDWFSGLMEKTNALDWGYLKIGAQRLYPTEAYYSENYEEGEIFP